MPSERVSFKSTRTPTRLSEAAVTPRGDTVSVLEEVILEDGQIQPSEQYYLLKMIYSDRVINDREREFLRKLKETATSISPDFEALCDTALDAPDTNWDIGGRERVS